MAAWIVVVAASVSVAGVSRAPGLGLRPLVPRAPSASSRLDFAVSGSTGGCSAALAQWMSIKHPPPPPQGADETAAEKARVARSRWEHTQELRGAELRA